MTQDCTQGDLQAAINAGGNGTVTLDGTCRYLLTSATYNSDVAGASGLLISQPVVLEGNGAIIERAPGAPQFRLLLISRDGLIVRNLTLRGGETSGHGGGVWVNQPATLQNVRLENNVAGSRGGGLYAIANLTLNNSTVVGNRSGGNGGGIYLRIWGRSPTVSLPAIRQGLVLPRCIQRNKAAH